jgi:dihydroxyacetone kinase-like protein
MTIKTMSTQQLPEFLTAVKQELHANADEIVLLDKTLGDGDHLANLERGLDAVLKQQDELTQLDWSAAFMKIGMTLMSTMGGASGSLFGTFFLSLSKASKGLELDIDTFSTCFNQAVESVKQRGKSDIGEKTMLDTLIPAASSLTESAEQNFTVDDALIALQEHAIKGMLSTKDMLATKGRASFLGERAIGHIDAGARTTQLIICTVAEQLKNN